MTSRAKGDANPYERQNVHDEYPIVVAEQRDRIDKLLGGPIPDNPAQAKSNPGVGLYAKPLCATSYSPLFYRARIGHAEPKRYR